MRKSGTKRKRKIEKKEGERGKKNAKIEANEE